MHSAQVSDTVLCALLFTISLEYRKRKNFVVEIFSLYS